MPKRIQMSRQHPWRADNPDAVIVARPSKWGNPFRVTKTYHADDVVTDFRTHLTARRRPWPGWADLIGYPSDDDIRAELGGRDLACWCPLDQACHGDVLLELANAP